MELACESNSNLLFLLKEMWPSLALQGISYKSDRVIVTFHGWT